MRFREIVDFFSKLFERKVLKYPSDFKEYLVSNKHFGFKIELGISKI